MPRHPYAAAVQQTRLSDRQRRRNRLFTTSGVVIEWYDFMVYGLLATTLGRLWPCREGRVYGERCPGIGRDVTEERVLRHEA